MLKERPFAFPHDRSVRVICDTDAYNECDDQYCISHIWMTPRFDVKAMISAHFGAAIGLEGTEPQSFDEIVKLAELMGIRDEVNILHGGTCTMPDENTPVDSEGARFIIEEAMKDDPRPLFVCVLGPATDIASACLMEPRIADRVTVIWIGGGAYPEGGFEFNLANDINAARALFKSRMELWQVPMNAYSTVKVSFYQLLNRVYPCGEIGKYLVENTMRVCELLAEVNPSAFGSELWGLGDSSVVGLMLCSTLGDFVVQDAPSGIFNDGRYDRSGPSSRKIRVYNTIDSNFILNDMFEKLKYNFG